MKRSLGSIALFIPQPSEKHARSAANRTANAAGPGILHCAGFAANLQRQLFDRCSRDAGTGSGGKEIICYSSSTTTQKKQHRFRRLNLCCSYMAILPLFSFSLEYSILPCRVFNRPHITISRREHVLAKSGLRSKLKNRRNNVIHEFTSGFHGTCKFQKIFFFNDLH